MPSPTKHPIPRVILGLMTFGPDPSTGGRITTLSEFNTFLDHLQAAGYNEVDTARMYIGGKQEAFTREAHWIDRGLKLATKCYPSKPGMHKPEVLTEQFESSLKDLGTNCVDIFYLHAADRSVPFTETLEAVDKLHKQGKFIQFGLSNFTAFEVAEIVMHCKYNNWVRPTIYQGMYNVLTRTLEQELIPTCRRYGLELVIYNPLAGGIFSGKYRKNETPSEGRFSDVGRSGEIYRKRYFRDSTFEALEIVEPVVAKYGLTMVETALRWCVHHSAWGKEGGSNDGIIVGVSSIEQLEQNIRACQMGTLPEEVVDALDRAWRVSKVETPNYWHLDLKYTYDTQKALFGI